jgi:hydrogenase-4 membrane subunit HyfE
MEKFCTVMTVMARICNVLSVVFCASSATHESQDYLFFLPFGLAVFLFYNIILLHSVKALRTYRKQRAAIVALCSAGLVTFTMGCCFYEIIDVRTALMGCTIGSGAAICLHHDEDKEKAEKEEVEQ